MATALVPVVATILALVPGARPARRTSSEPRARVAQTWITHVMPPDPSQPTHYSWEPGVATGPDGVLWAIADHCQLVQQFGACQLSPTSAGPQPDAVYVWRSRDGGRSWAFVTDPIRLPGNATDAPGGIDSDIAVAPVARVGKPALVYVVSNWVGGFTLAVSGNNGRSWATTEADGFAGTDRPWVAATGACTVYVGVHPVTGAENVASQPFVARYDGCTMLASARAGVTVGEPEAITPVEPLADEATRTNQDFGKLTAFASDVYVPYVACDTPATAALTDPSCAAPSDIETLAVARSTNGGRSFTDIPIARGALRINLDDGTWPLSLAVDPAGDAVLAADTGTRLLTYDSTDFGVHWRPLNGLSGQPQWPFAGVPSVAIAGARYVIGWYASPRAPAGADQRFYLRVAQGQLGVGAVRRLVLPVMLASTPHGTPLDDTLSDDFAAAIAHGHPVFILVEDCAGHPASQRSCPPIAGVGRALIARYAWLAATWPGTRG